MKKIALIEIYIGIFLLSLSAVVHIHGYTCFLSEESCGMIEGLYSLWAALFGSAFLIAGLCLELGGNKAWLGHLVVLYIAVFSVTIQ